MVPIGRLRIVVAFSGYENRDCSFLFLSVVTTTKITELVCILHYNGSNALGAYAWQYRQKSLRSLGSNRVPHKTHRYSLCRDITSPAPLRWCGKKAVWWYIDR